MDWMKKLLAVAGFAIALALGPATLTGCEDSNDMDDSINDTMDEAEDNMDDAADNMEDSMDNAADNVDDAMD